MSSGRLGSGRYQFEEAHPNQPTGPNISAEIFATKHAERQLSTKLNLAITRTQDYLLSQQAPEGYWVGELEGDTILESEYILLLTFLEQEKSEEATLAANYLREQQLAEGGWSIYPGGPLEISASVKSYFALKLTGDSPDAEHMQRAKAAILQAGGVEQVNSFTRYYLALLGILSYDQCPAVPPELMLIPKWMPFNIYEMSAWSRTILVPLSLLWAYQPVKNLPDEFHIDEIFIGAPEDLTIAMLPTATLDQLSKTRKFNWRSFFQVVDRGIKTLESMRCKPLRQHSINKAAQWMIERFENSDGLGAIFPPIIWSVVALKCLGHDEDSPLVQNALNELKKLQIREGNTLRLQPCKSPVWDTAISTIALRDSGVPAEHPAMKLSVKWLLSKEVRNKGDWSARNPKQQTGGWFFEFENAFYPDVDDTAMVVLALSRCVPAGQGSGWLTDYLLDPNWSPHETDREVTAALAGRNHTMQSA